MEKLCTIKEVLQVENEGKRYRNIVWGGIFEVELTCGIPQLIVKELPECFSYEVDECIEDTFCLYTILSAEFEEVI